MRSGFRKRSKEQVVADGIHVGDAEHVGDQAACGRAARDAAHAVAAGIVGVVPDDQEVGDEALGAENAELIVQLVLERLADRAVAFLDALADRASTDTRPGTWNSAGMV